MPLPRRAHQRPGGDWEYGPGMDLFRTLEEKLGKLPIVAEDLGDLFDSVRVLRKAATRA